MEEKYLTQIKFGSFIKLCSSIFFSLGTVFGFIFFIIGLLGGEVTASLGSLQLKGIPAGAVGLILSPIIFSLFGLILGLFSFLPFKFLLKISKGLKMNVKFE